MACSLCNSWADNNVRFWQSKYEQCFGKYQPGIFFLLSPALAQTYCLFYIHGHAALSYVLLSKEQREKPKAISPADVRWPLDDCSPWSIRRVSRARGVRVASLCSFLRTLHLHSTMVDHVTVHASTYGLGSELFWSNEIWPPTHQTFFRPVNNVRRAIFEHAKHVRGLDFPTVANYFGSLGGFKVFF